MRARRGTVARMTGSQRLFVYKLRLLRHKTLYSVCQFSDLLEFLLMFVLFCSSQIGELESILEKDLRSLAEATDTEIATNEKRMQQVRVMGQLLTSIREYMRDMPICKAYFSPFPPASHLDHSARSSVRPLIKGIPTRPACRLRYLTRACRWRGDSLQTAQAENRNTSRFRYAARRLVPALHQRIVEGKGRYHSSLGCVFMSFCSGMIWELKSCTGREEGRT